MTSHKKKHIDFKIQTFADGVWISHAMWRRIKKFLEDHDLTVVEGEKK